ncbi:MAG: esterase family protein [Saprospiraceae bacterium]|nr:esterase family protein [Saprospiraceae bacterium]
MKFLSVFLTIFLAFHIASVSIGQTGKVYDDLTLHSDILNMDRKYAVYLPPDYETSERSYPVLYLLHGAGDDQTGWVQFGEILHIADKSIREGSATAMVVVMPDANTGQRGYFNSMDGTFRYEDFFFEELMPHVEKKFRIKSEKRYRAIAGLSMGGGGSFMYALHHPDLFSSACPLSAYVGPLSLDDVKARMQRQGQTVPADEVLKSYYDKHNAVNLVESMEADEIKKVRWFIDCGDDDFLYEGNALIHIALRKKEVPHEYRVRDGGHTWTYWRESLPVVLSFVSDAFHQH